jgi:predicted outer membrane repeat protein
MLALLSLLTTASAQDVCTVGCPHASIQSAIDAVNPGDVGIITVESRVWDENLVVEAGRRITLLPPLDAATIASVLLSLTNPKAVEPLGDLAPIVITSSQPLVESVITVRDSSLNLVGVALDGNLVRALDANDSDVLFFASTVFARGLNTEGGLVRVNGGSFTATVVSFRDGEAGSAGGLVAAYDADVHTEGVSFEDGAGTFGGCLYVTSGTDRHTVTLNATVFRGCTSGGIGGALYVRGELDVTAADLSITNSNAIDGGAIAIIGPGPTVVVDQAAWSDNTAFGRGGAVFTSDADLTLVGAGITSNASNYGGGVAQTGDGVVSLQSSIIDDNSALYGGGGAYVASGHFEAIDTLYQRNNVLFGDGGGLWIGDEATWDRDIRSTFCGNTAVSGGGIYSHQNTITTLSNLRLLDNVASNDGGGIAYYGSEELTLSFANLLGNSAGRGSGAAILTTGPMFLRDSIVGYSLGAVAVVPRAPSGRVNLGPMAWWANDRGNLDGLAPNAQNAVFTDPLLDRFSPGEACELAQDWPIYRSPLRDAGTPLTNDRDGTRADIGAYGGPLAPLDLWETDIDGDGFPQIYDCDDGDEDVNPLADDEPYDGLDSDCGNNDDFDADGDGFRGSIVGGPDCRDDDIASYPGAPESPESPFDQNCDGVLDADLDGFLRIVPEGSDLPIDCDDGDPLTYPGAPDDDIQIDRNCDGIIDGPRSFQSAGCRVAPASGPSGFSVWLRRR